MTSIFQQLLDRKLVSILKEFVQHPKDLYHLSKLSTVTKVPLGTTHRLLKKLVKLEVIEAVPVGKITVYRLGQTKKVEDLKKWIK